MLEASRRWLKRNRTYFAVGASVVGAGYVAGQYVLSRFTDARQKMSDDRVAKENLRRRFEQNQEDCTFTILAILPTATGNIFAILPVEDTLAQLQRQRAERIARSNAGSEAASSVAMSGPASTVGDDESSSMKSDGFVHASQILQQESFPPSSKKTKAQLWDQMKIESISRSFALIYTLALLTLFTRIQLNLLGRRNYLASVVSLAVPHQHPTITLDNQDDDNLDNAYGNDYNTVRRYLSFSWWLLNRGCKDILEQVTRAVQEAFGPINPRDDISLQKLSELTIDVRKRVEGATDKSRKEKKWLVFLMPPADKEEYLLRESKTVSPDVPSSCLITPLLRRLLDETADLIDYPAFSIVLTHLLDAGFTHLTHSKVAPTAFKIPTIVEDQTTAVTGPGAAGTITEVTDPSAVKAKLASCLAVYCRQAAVIGAGDSSGTAAILGSLAPDSLLGSSHGGNEYLAVMESVPMLNSFAAVVYSSNFEYEMADPTEAIGGLNGNPSFGFGGEEEVEEEDKNHRGHKLERKGDGEEPVKKDVLVPGAFSENYSRAFEPNGPGMVSLGPVTRTDEMNGGEGTVTMPTAHSTGPTSSTTNEPTTAASAQSPPTDSANVDFDAVWNKTSSGRSASKDAGAESSQSQVQPQPRPSAAGSEPEVGGVTVSLPEPGLDELLSEKGKAGTLDKEKEDAAANGDSETEAVGELEKGKGNEEVGQGKGMAEREAKEHEDSSPSQPQPPSQTTDPDVTVPAQPVSDPNTDLPSSGQAGDLDADDSGIGASLTKEGDETPNKKQGWDQPNVPEKGNRKGDRKRAGASGSSKAKSASGEALAPSPSPAKQGSKDVSSAQVEPKAGSDAVVSKNGSEGAPISGHETKPSGGVLPVQDATTSDPSASASGPKTASSSGPAGADKVSASEARLEKKSETESGVGAGAEGTKDEDGAAPFIKLVEDGSAMAASASGDVSIGLGGEQNRDRAGAEAEAGAGAEDSKASS